MDVVAIKLLVTKAECTRNTIKQNEHSLDVTPTLAVLFGAAAAITNKERTY